MFDPTTFTGFHTWLSLIALATGMVVSFDLWTRRIRPVLTAVFLATAIATSVTGFGFPFTGVLPSHIVGVISLLALLIALVALYGRRLSGGWRAAYAISAILSVYLLAFVTIAQIFQKVPGLGGQGLGFAIAQLVVLAAFVGLGLATVRGGPATQLA